MCIYIYIINTVHIHILRKQKGLFWMPLIVFYQILKSNFQRTSNIYYNNIIMYYLCIICLFAIKSLLDCLVILIFLFSNLFLFLFSDFDIFLVIYLYFYLVIFIFFCNLYIFL